MRSQVYRSVQSALRRSYSSQSGLERKVAVLGAAGGIRQPLSLLMKLNPLVSRLALYDIAGRSELVQKPSQTRQFFSHASRASENPISGNEIVYLRGWRQKSHSVASINPGCLNQRSGIYASRLSPCISRSLASSSGSEQPGKNQNQTKKDLSTVEDPFDAPTYHIPEKPVTFTEGASYSLVILAGLGIAGAAAYGVFKELIFQPKEYKIFDKALARVQEDSQVRVRIGTPIKGYGQETRNRAARQRIPNRIWTDEDGVEHVQVIFQIRGPHGGGQVRCEMFKDKTDNQWKFTYLLVDIQTPSRLT